MEVVAAVAAHKMLSRNRNQIGEPDMTGNTRHWGLGWRPELAWFIDNSPLIGFVEVIAESISREQPLPPAIARLQSRHVPIIPHGISLSLGGAEPLDSSRIRKLAEAAERLQAPLVSEHIAFVRGAGLEVGHLLPVPRTRTALQVIVENIRLVQAELPVPLAVENIATLFQWPDAEFNEAEFLTEILEQTGALLLLDLANVHANARNHGGEALELLDRLPLERVAYVHVAGGTERQGVYHDTHAHPLTAPVLELLNELCSRNVPAGVLLERDDQFPTSGELERELAALSDIYKAAIRKRATDSESYRHVC